MAAIPAPMEGVQITPVAPPSPRGEDVDMHEEGRGASPALPDDASQTLYISNLNESIKLPGMSYS